jgi:hypothetical protein
MTHLPIVQEAGWAPEPVWTQRIEEISFASAGDRTSIAWKSNPYPDTILTELPWLLIILTIIIMMDVIIKTIIIITKYFP